LAGVVAYLNQSNYISVTLTDGSGLTDFYQRFGFHLVDLASPTRVWRRGTATVPTQTDHPLSSLSMPTAIPSTRPKIIGILGGISHESTIAYYDRILKKYHALKQDYYYPRIVIHSLDFQTFTDLENQGDRPGYIREIMSGIRSLEAAGVDFILMAANSPHSVFADIAAQAAVPLLSIVQETVRYAQALHLTRLLLLGIKYTMQADFYQRACRSAGIEVLTPSEAEQDQINGIIFNELVLGNFRPASKATLLEIIGRYAVDGVILGCTELPLIIEQADLAIPAIDTLDLHAEAAIKYALMPREQS
jgi:aspartate racemase